MSLYMNLFGQKVGVKTVKHGPLGHIKKRQGLLKSVAPFSKIIGYKMPKGQLKMGSHSKNP